jgi:hypothetical protein
MVGWITDFQKWVDRKDKHLVVIKFIFLLLNVILYTTYTYQLDYIKDEWNLDITRFGYISSIPAFTFFCSIAWSAFAQRTGWYKGIILCAGFFYSAFFSCLYFLQPFFGDHTEDTRFIVLLSIYGPMSILSAAFFPLLDHVIYSKLNKDERFSPESFGRLRLWGTVGQGLAGFFSGQLIKFSGYGAVFVLSSVLSFLFLVAVTIGINSEDGKPNEKANEKSKTPVSWRSALIKLMGIEFIFFLLVVLVASYSRATVGNFLMRYLISYLAIDQQISGIFLLIRTVPEIACFFYTKNLLLNLGVHKLLLFAQLAGLIRVVAYAWLPKSFTWAPILIESLRGANNAFLHASGVRLAYELAPAESQAISQGFFHGIFGNLTTGLAGIIGSWIANVVIAQTPTATEADIIRTIFKSSAFASIFGLLIFGAFYWISRKSRAVAK